MLRNKILLLVIPALITLACGEAPPEKEKPPLEKSSLVPRPQGMIVFSTPGLVEMQRIRGLELRYREAFRRMGYSFQLRGGIPPLRSLLMANSGEADGEVARVRDVLKATGYKNLIRVNEQVAAIRVKVYAVRPGLFLDNVKQLKPHRYGYIRGLIAIEEYLKQEKLKRDGVEMLNWKQSVRMLVAGRVDFLITIEDVAFMIKQSKEFKDVNLKEVKVLYKRPLFPYLHKKHAKLAPILAQTLRQMKSDGSWNKVLRNPKPK